MDNQGAVCGVIKDETAKDAGASSFITTLLTITDSTTADDLRKKELKAGFDSINYTSAADFRSKFAELFASDRLPLYLEPSYDRKSNRPHLGFGASDNMQGLIQKLEDTAELSLDQIIELYDCGESAEEFIKELISDDAKDYAEAFCKVLKGLSEEKEYTEKFSGTSVGESVKTTVQDLVGDSYKTKIEEFDIADVEFKFFNYIDDAENPTCTLDEANKFLQLFYLLGSWELYNSSHVKESLPFRLPALQYFIKNYDNDGKNKEYVTNMCKEFQAKFIERLESNTWMSSSSKSAAKIKAEKMLFVAGYPENIATADISEIKIADDAGETFIAKYISVYNSALKFSLEQFIDATDETEKFAYHMIMHSDPFDANAFYSPDTNTVFILPTNLVDPICNTEYADAYNYAILGASTVGHEMCHAFDANGSQYDEYGNKKDWWAVADKLRYAEKKTAMTTLFDMFTTPESATSLKGDTTLGENMADYGGLVVAYDLFVEKKINEGFGGDALREQKKMFFQSFAIAWSGITSDADMVKQIKSDEHAPAYFRTNGNICQMDEWYDLYGVAKGDRYYLEPGQRVILW